MPLVPRWTGSFHLTTFRTQEFLPGWSSIHGDTPQIARDGCFSLLGHSGETDAPSLGFLADRLRMSRAVSSARGGHELGVPVGRG